MRANTVIKRMKNSTKIRYKLNRETLTYEVVEVSRRERRFRQVLLFVLSFVAFGGYYYLYSQVLGWKTPKQVLVERRAAEWQSKLDELTVSLEKNYQILNELERRDNKIYRPVFGMDEIAEEVRNAGIGGVDRYGYLEVMDPNGRLLAYVESFDILSKKAYIQSHSYDDVFPLAQTADQMSLCMPTICPVSPDQVRLTSSYGYRKDPKDGKTRFHEGLDLAGKVGLPVYVSGNATVVDVGFDFFGYGHFVLVDHGFGYKSRYAHLSKVYVSEGQSLKRGDQLGEMGNSGKSTGPHLHYEIMYKNRPVNPYKFFDFELPAEDYHLIVRSLGSGDRV